MSTTYDLNCTPFCSCMDAANDNNTSCCQCWRNNLEYLHFTISGSNPSGDNPFPDILCVSAAAFGGCTYCLDTDSDFNGVQNWNRNVTHPCTNFDCSSSGDPAVYPDCDAHTLTLRLPGGCDTTINVDFCDLGAKVFSGFEPFDFNTFLGCNWTCAEGGIIKCFQPDSATVTIPCSCGTGPVDCWDECCQCCTDSSQCTETYMSSMSFMNNISRLMKADSEINFSKTNKKFNLNLVKKRKFLIGYVKQILNLVKNERGNEAIKKQEFLSKLTKDSNMSDKLKEYLDEAQWVYKNQIYIANDKLHVKLDKKDKPIVFGKNLTKEVLDFEKVGGLSLPTPAAEGGCGCNKKRDLGVKKIEKKNRKIF